MYTCTVHLTPNKESAVLFAPGAHPNGLRNAGRTQKPGGVKVCGNLTEEGTTWFRGGFWGFSFDLVLLKSHEKNGRAHSRLAIDAMGWVLAGLYIVGPLEQKN